MDITYLIDSKAMTSPLTTSAALPTPAQTPSKAFPTPIADSYGDIFDLDAPLPHHAPPPYTAIELELALENPPVEVNIWYGAHTLHGTLYYIPSLFSKLHERFFDISPSDRPKLDEAHCKPWTLLNQLHGQTWVDEGLLGYLGVNTAQKAYQEPRFVAITDNSDVLFSALAVHGNRLGDIKVHGTFELNERIGASEDIIVGLPSARSLLGRRPAPMMFQNNFMARPVQVPTSGAATIYLKDLTPTPASPTVMAAVAKIISAADDSSNITQSGVPKRNWLTMNLPEHFGYPAVAKFGRPATASTHPTLPTPPAMPVPQQSKSRAATLSPSSPLWPHRGNEALFKRAIWSQLCYTSTQSDSSVALHGGVKIPDAYAQVLFEDLQGRTRVAGSEELAAVDRKWYGPEEVKVDGVECDGVGAVGTVEGGSGTIAKAEGGGNVGEMMDVD